MHQGADSFEGHNEIMGSKPKKAYLAPFIENMEEVKAALENEGYKVTIPNPKMPYLLVNDLVIVADNIETDYGQIYNVSAPLDYISFEEVLKIGNCVRKKCQSEQSDCTWREKCDSKAFTSIYRTPGRWISRRKLSKIKCL